MTLNRLKKNKEEAGRSKMIRMFIKDQLTSGKTLVYAYRHMKYNGTWIKTKPEQAEQFRRSISPVSLDSQERARYLELLLPGSTRYQEEACEERV